MLIEAAIEEYRDHYYDIDLYGTPDDPTTSTPAAEAARTRILQQAVAIRQRRNDNTKQLSRSKTKRSVKQARKFPVAPRMTTKGTTASSSGGLHPGLPSPTCACE